MAAIQVTGAPSTDRESRPQDLHVMPCYGKEHDSDPRCWCNPALNYEDPETRARVWVHRDMN